MNKGVSLRHIIRRRVALHALFWAVVYVLFVIIYAVKSDYLPAAYSNLFYMPVYMAYFYVMAYWLLPAYLLNNHYWKFLAYVLVFAFISALACRLVDILIVVP
jgi:hypothetical protein